jgi:ketosteroid isomerase-like protein
MTATGGAAAADEETTAMTASASTEETAEHPNARVLRRFFAAFAAGDRDAVRDCVTERFAWRFPGMSAYAGDFHGVDGLFDGIRSVAITLGRGMLGFELLHVFADDDAAVTVHRDYYTGTGNHLDLRYVLFVRIVDGRMDEVWEIPFDQAENDRYVGVQAADLARTVAAGSS